MNHLTLWKEEARAEFMNTSAYVRLVNPSEFEDAGFFLDTLIDQIHAHTLEEVRGRVEEIKRSFEIELLGTHMESDYLYSVRGSVEALKDILELLEYPTD